MHTSTKSLFLNSIVLILFISYNAFGQSSARYTVTFEGLWNSADHGMLPTNDHWSDLVGGTHNSNIMFWEENQLASPGIESVAENGVNDTFFSEFTSAMTNGDADQWLQEVFSPNEAMGSCIIMDVVVSQDHPLLTLITMIAPSPDWFAGITSFSLLDGSNNWKMTIPDILLYPYDAGTEDGTGYSTSNSATMPHVPIFSRINMTPFNDQPVGSLSITFEELLDIEEFSFENISLFPNPVSSEFTIKLKNQSALPDNLKIYNMLGQLIEVFEVNTLNDLSVDVSKLSDGLYYVKIDKEGRFSSFPFIKKQ